jgi:hypothetical protein
MRGRDERCAVRRARHSCKTTTGTEVYSNCAALSSFTCFDGSLLGKPRLLQKTVVRCNIKKTQTNRESDLRFFCIYAAARICDYTFFRSKIGPIFFVLQVKQRHSTVNRNAWKQTINPPSRCGCEKKGKSQAQNLVYKP